MEEIKDPTFLKEQVKILRETTNKLSDVSALFMIVDDNKKNRLVFIWKYSTSSIKIGI